MNRTHFTLDGAEIAEGDDTTRMTDHCVTDYVVRIRHNTYVAPSVVLELLQKRYEVLEVRAVEQRVYMK